MSEPFTPALSFTDACNAVSRHIDQIEAEDESSSWEGYSFDLPDFISFIHDHVMQLGEMHGSDHRGFDVDITRLCALGVITMIRFGIAVRGRDSGDPGTVTRPSIAGPLDRVIAFAALSGERMYQDGLPESRCVGKSGQGGNRIEDNPLSYGATRVMLRTYVREADEKWTRVAGDDASLHSIRKITSICLRHVETYGAGDLPEEE